MILVVIFCLLVLTDIIEVLKTKQFRKNLDKKEFLQLTLIFVGSLFGIWFIANLFHLNMKYQIYLMVVVMVSVLLIFSYNLNYLKHKHDFEDLSQYMLRLCVYFRAHQKIQPSLLDAAQGFEGPFKKKVDQIAKDYETNNDFEKAIVDLSHHYLMKSLIEVFKSSEKVGHSHSDSQLIRLESDIEAWIYQTRAYQKEEEGLRNRMMMLFGIGIMISYFAQNMLMQSMEMQSHATYQLMIFSFLGANVMAITFLNRRVIEPWFLKKEDL